MRVSLPAPSIRQHARLHGRSRQPAGPACRQPAHSQRPARLLTARAAAEVEQLAESSQEQQGGAASPLAAGGHRVAVLQARKAAVLDVPELGRPLGEAPTRMRTCRCP